MMGPSVLSPTRIGGQLTSPIANKKVALVTGAALGMGKAFTKALLDAGMIVYAAARRVEQMADLVALGAIAWKRPVSTMRAISSRSICSGWRV